jgi:hypothetical protein
MPLGPVDFLLPRPIFQFGKRLLRIYELGDKYGIASQTLRLVLERYLDLPLGSVVVHLHRVVIMN